MEYRCTEENGKAVKIDDAIAASLARDDQVELIKGRSSRVLTVISRTWRIDERNAPYVLIFLSDRPGNWRN